MQRMEQKHKHSSFKCSDSESKTQEPPTMSKSNKVISGPSSDSGATEPIKNSAENQSNLKSKGFRSLFKILPFGSSNKSKGLSNKKQNDKANTPLEDEDIRRLIGLYSKYENLYNCNNSQYGNKQIDNIYYSDMARSFTNKTGPDIQATLIELRAEFEHEYALIQNARLSDGCNLTPTFAYYNEFLFLVPFISMEKTTEEAEERSQEEPTHIDVSTFSSQCSNTHYTSDKSLGANGLVKYSTATFQNQCVSHLPGTQFVGLTSRNIIKNPLSNSKHKNFGKKKKSLDHKSKIEENAKLLDKKPNNYDKSIKDTEPEQNAKSRNDTESLRNDQSLNDTEPLRTDESKIKSELQKDTDTLGRDKSNAGGPTVANSKNDVDLDNQDLKSEYQTQTSADKQQAHVQIQTSESALQKALSRGQQSSRLSSRFDQSKCIALTNRPNQAQHNGNQRICEPRSRQEQRAGSSRNNGHQLEMLCEMIKAELSSAPDCIYFDAKWRIIEILREVNKRQMIYKKGDPSQGTNRKTDIEAYYNIRVNNSNMRNMSSSCPYCAN